jgi:hypothetical protein
MNEVINFGMAAGVMLVGVACSSADPMGKFQESASAVRDRYDVKLGVVPVPGKDGWAVAGPFIVTPRRQAGPEPGAKGVVGSD